MFGDKHEFRLNYYLADDSIQINTVIKPNSGYDSYPNLLNRQRVPRRVLYHDDRMRTVEDDTGMEDYYNYDDLRVGQTINILGRDLLFCDCDEFTQKWYLSNHGVDQRANVVKVEAEKTVRPKAAIPPPTGFGSEEDSLTSVFSLMPKVWPKRPNFNQL